MRKLNITPKEQLFWWRLVNNALPTNLWLNHRKLKDFVFCPRNCSDIEDSNHVYVRCLKLNEIFDMLKQWGIQLPIFCNLDDCLKKSIDYGYFISGNYFFLPFSARNNYKHGVKVPTSTVIASYILSYSFQPRLIPICRNWDANRHLMLSKIWYPPPSNWIKLNVDVALTLSNLASIVGVLRDHKGRFLLAYYGRRLKHWEISFMELLAIFEFKNVIQEWMRDKQGIIIEGDSSIVISLLRSSFMRSNNQKNMIRRHDFYFLDVFRIQGGGRCLFSICPPLRFFWDAFVSSELPSRFVDLIKEDCDRISIT
ncbi:hypothetical protein M5K25_004705 [Dendrobium thyrsiflorum]|uniref:Reverse transcriptase zinc-binding domain-containing protein n=1 Tax=Dendrobium thyrsiflorum TaxID=117978 RepID=A0ABD0VMX5_DENTH